jgi:ATP-binding cassette subfamily B protein
LATDARYRALHDQVSNAASSTPDGVALVKSSQPLPEFAQGVAQIAAHTEPRSFLSRFRLVWPFVVSKRWSLAAAALLVLASCLAAAFVPMTLGHLVGEATKGASLLRGASLLVAVVVGERLTSAGKLLWLQQIGASVVLAFRQHIFDIAERFVMRVFDRISVGRLVTAVVNDVDGVGILFSPTCVDLLNHCLTLVAIAVIMFGADWRLALVSLSLLPLVATMLLVGMRRSREAYRRVRTAQADISADLNEQIAGRSVIRAFGLQSTMAARFDAINSRFRTAIASAASVETVLDAGMELLQLTAVVALLMWAARERGQGAALTFAMLVTFTKYMEWFFASLGGFGIRLPVIQGAIAAIERLDDVVATSRLEADEARDAVGRDNDGVAEAFAFENVRFSYLEGHPTLLDISFQARPGQRIALVGQTGAGKSTIAHLLLRLYDVDEGEVRVLGQDVRRWPRRALRRTFSVVAQDVHIAAGTLLQNIALGDRRPDRARASNALMRLGVAELFAERMGGLDAVVTDGGANFSMGERQLLCFARALYQDAPILLLDEATANVDVHTESIVRRAVISLLVDRTTLIIAHRLSTIEDADLILVFERGRVVERGCHRELLLLGGYYSRLCAAQQVKAGEAADASGAAHGKRDQIA